MKNIICNAFSLQMVSPELMKHVRFEVLETMPSSIIKGAESAVGHADTAAFIGVECNRADIVLEEGTTLYIAQFIGGRLPEGCTTLPEGFELIWVMAYLEDFHYG